MKAILRVALLGLIGSTLLSSCQSSSSPEEEVAPIMDTVITEIRDTIITFYPETYEEVMEIVTSYDTVITPRAEESE